MALFSLTEEKIDELNNRYKNKENELKKIESTTEIDQWKFELNEFRNEYIKWLDKYKINNDKLVIKTKTKLVSKSVKESDTKKKVIKKN